MVLGDFNVDYGRYTADSAVKMFANAIIVVWVANNSFPGQLELVQEHHQF